MHRLTSLLLIVFAGLLVAGCGKGKTTDDGKKPKDDGEKYVLYHTEEETHHLRVVIDAEKKHIKVTVYDERNSKLKPLVTDSLTMDLGKEQIELNAETAKEGGNTAFAATHDRLAQAVDHKKVLFQGKVGEKKEPIVFKLDTQHAK
jgi:hypothetical protein